MAPILTFHSIYYLATVARCRLVGMETVAWLGDALAFRAKLRRCDRASSSLLTVPSPECLQRQQGFGETLPLTYSTSLQPYSSGATGKKVAGEVRTYRK